MNESPKKGKENGNLTETQITEKDLIRIGEMQVRRYGLNKITEEEINLIFVAEKNGITYDESTKFIRKNSKVFMTVAEKLYQVKHYKLYRLGYNSFEEYAREMFDFTRQRAYQLSNAYKLSLEIKEEFQCHPITS